MRNFQFFPTLRPKHRRSGSQRHKVVGTIFNFQTIKNQAGQSIIEAVVAVSVVTLVIITLVSAVTVSIKNASFAKNKSLATKFVNQGLEAVRSIRDRDWQKLADVSDGTLRHIFFNGSQWEFSDNPDIPAPNFTREVWVTGNDPDVNKVTEANVEIKVNWVQGTKTFSSSSITNFTRWKP